MKVADYIVSDKQRLALAATLALFIHAAVLGMQLTSPRSSTEKPVHSLNVSLLKKDGGEPLAAAPEQEIPLVLPTPSRSVLAPPRPVDSVITSEPDTLIATLSSATHKTAPWTMPPPAVQPSPEPDNPAATRRPAPAPEASESLPEPLPAPLPGPTRRPRQMPPVSRPLAPPRPESDYSREKHIDPDSMTTLEQYYVQAWVRRIEKMATLNFPQEALQRNLTGNLMLDVALNTDGSIHSITLVKSSGHSVLDNAAREIVEKAAPYAPFPEELRHRYDILHIARIWSFLPGGVLD